MSQSDTQSQFVARLERPAEPGKGDAAWGFVVLPKDASAKLPRRGRTSIDGTINGQPFTTLLEPDGQRSHWFRVDPELLAAADASLGDEVELEVSAVEEEPEPDVPEDFLAALEASPEALETWQATTTLARVDWIHWVTSAKQAKTRSKRIADGCDMLGSGKKRVCCFDSSGVFSKALSAPKSVDD